MEIEKDITTKKRNYGFIIYPHDYEKVQLNKIITDMRLPIILSPIHDKDVDKKGVLKKEHHHGILLLDGPVRISQALNLLKPLNIDYVEQIHSLQGYKRYICHLEETDKAHYNPEDVKCYYGASYDIIALGVDLKSRNELICEMCDFIIDNEISEMVVFYTHAKKLGKIEWLDILGTGAVSAHINRMMFSVRYMSRETETRRNEKEHI